MSTNSSATSVELRPDHKLRNLPLKVTNELISILNRNDCWENLAQVITHPDRPTVELFNSDNINILKKQWNRGSSPAEAMLNHWSTTGRNQPNLGDLIHFLKAAGRLRAASDVRKILNLEEESHTVTNGDNEEADNIFTKALEVVNKEGIDIYPYTTLEVATDDFSVESQVGYGSFGTVHKAVIKGKVVAVKRLKKSVDQFLIDDIKDPVDQFLTELKNLTRYRHENLLPLLGCSLQGPFCLIYEFMVNGSLADRLACFGNSAPLPWDLRLKIAYGTALGINHLHTSGEKPMVHRDIKSGNILLDEDFVPKVGDFGLVRISESRNSTVQQVTQHWGGTPAYYAPEAPRGDVSVKLDTFSFGVVLQELLTGLPPVDQEREDPVLFMHMQNCEDILTMVDPKAEWNPDAAKELYKISKLCLKEKKGRPTISQTFCNRFLQTDFRVDEVCRRQLSKILL